MSPAIPSSHHQNPSDLNPNAPPFNNPAALRRSMQLALLPRQTKNPTHTDGRTSPLPFKPTAAADDSPVFFYHPAVIPNTNRLFFYYHYPPSHTQPYVLSPSPVYTNNNYYYSGGLGPITIRPQPLPLNHGMEPAPEPKPLPASVVPNGGERLIIENRSGDDGGVARREKKKKKKSKAAKVVSCWPPRQMSSRPLPPPWCRRTKKTNNSASRAARTSNESSPALISDGGEKTTLMIKNIPNHFRRGDLLRYLDNHCARHNNVAARQLTSPSDAIDDLVPSEYDFFYLPMDFRTGANLGYAFVNFTTSIGASRFEASFQKYKWDEVVRPGNRRKVCQIVAAKFQGKEQLIEQFRGSRFYCRYNFYLPAYFSPPRDGFNASSPILVGQRVQ